MQETRDPLAYSLSQLGETAGGICRATIYNLIKEGRGPRLTKIGKRTVVLRDDAEAWLRSFRDGGVCREEAMCEPGMWGGV